MTHPLLVLKYKHKDTLVQKGDSLYYLYRMHSRWNKGRGHSLSQMNIPAG